MKPRILIIVFCVIGSLGYSQAYTKLTVYQNKKNGTQTIIQSVDDRGGINIDLKKHTILIESVGDGIIIQGHSMKQLTANRYRFHKYNKENTDFEVEVFDDSVILYTQLAFWFSGFKYKTIFQTTKTKGKQSEAKHNNNNQNSTKQRAT